MIVRHRKRGGRYWVQSIESFTFLSWNADMDVFIWKGHIVTLQTALPLCGRHELVIYQAEDKTHWARPYDEFFDGRFKVLSP